jgi:hypothetical protein
MNETLEKRINRMEEKCGEIGGHSLAVIMVPGETPQDAIVRTIGKDYQGRLRRVIIVPAKCPSVPDP